MPFSATIYWAIRTAAATAATAATAAMVTINFFCVKRVAYCFLCWMWPVFDFYAFRTGKVLGMGSS